jgi:hypothetical protein
LTLNKKDLSSLMISYMNWHLELITTHFENLIIFTINNLDYIW